MKTRLLKAVCGDCAYTVRVARSWLAQVVPECPLGHGRMEAPEWESEQERQRDARMAAESASVPAARLLRDRWVTTRAPHVCDGCRLEHQHPEKMRHRVLLVGGELLSTYTCLCCDSPRQERGGSRALARA